MAINMMDGFEFPRLDYTAPSGPISVVEADSNFKAHKEESVPQERPKLDKRYKEMAKKKAQEMEAYVPPHATRLENLADMTISRRTEWSDDEEPSELRQTSSRWDKVVVVKNVFTSDDLEDDEAMDEIKEDMEEEAEKFGQVSNITLFDKEEQGVVTIRFQNAAAAAACVQKFNGRSFDKRQLEAFIATGNEHFKRSRGKPGHQSSAADEEKRLEEYSNFIEGKAGDGNDSPARAANGGSNT